MKIKSIHRSCQYRKQLNSFDKDRNYDLITPNGIIRHFIVFIEVEELGSQGFQLESHGQKGLNNVFKATLDIVENVLFPERATAS